MRLFHGSYYPIGIDISDFSIKAAQLVKTGKKIDVQALGFAELTPGLIENGAIANSEDVAGVIKKLLNKPKFGKFMSREAVVCLPENKTFIKLIEIENSPNPLEDLIEVEIQKHIPYTLNEIYYDWQKINKKESTSVVIAAAPCSLIDQYTELLGLADLTIIAFEVEAAAICRSLLDEEAPKYSIDSPYSYCLIDIGAKRSSIIFYSGRSVLFTISTPISGQTVTKTIAETLEIDYDQAEKAKIICGFDDKIAQGVIKNVLVDTVNQLVKKINDAMQYYQIHYPNNGKINKIILTGGGANIKELDRILSEATNLPVLVGNPLGKLEQYDKINRTKFSETHKLPENLLNKKKKNDKPAAITQTNTNAYTTAIGLALRGVYEEYL